MSWSYDEFLAELKTLGYRIPKPDEYSSFECGGLMTVGKKPAFVNSWHVGGIRGCGYWGTSDKEAYTTGDPEPEWDDLVKVLEHFCPNITYLRYRSIMTKVHSDSYSRNDYYGNESNDSYRYIFLEDLFKHLRDHDLFERKPIDDSE